MKRDELILRAVDAVNGVLRGCTLSAEDAVRLRNFLWDEVQRVVKPNEKAILVPEPMLEAAHEQAVHSDGSIEESVRAALRWLSENPIMPSEAWCQDQVRKAHDWLSTATFASGAIAEWQRQMFLASEPEVPEAIRDLLMPLPEATSFPCHKACVLEAFRRGEQTR